MSLSEAESLYTRRARLYDLVFLRFFQYQNGVHAFLNTTEYLRSEARVLDAGCGSGAVTKAMYGIAERKGFHNIRFDAFDLTQSMLDIFNTWISDAHATGIHVAQADVLRWEQLPSDWSGYDLVISSAMLEYLSKAQLGPALTNLRRRLGKDGKIVIFITKKNFVMTWLIHKWWKANMYERGEIQEVFRRAGFNDVAFRRFPFPYNFLNCWGFIVEATAGS